MPKVMVIYYSRTGNTEKMAELMAQGCREVSGVEVEMVKLPGVDMTAVLEAHGFAQAPAQKLSDILAVEVGFERIVPGGKPGILMPVATVEMGEAADDFDV